MYLNILLVCKSIFSSLQCKGNWSYHKHKLSSPSTRSIDCTSKPVLNCSLHTNPVFKAVHVKWGEQTGSSSTKQQAAGQFSDLHHKKRHAWEDRALPRSLSKTLLVTSSRSRPWNQRRFLYVPGPAFILKNLNWRGYKGKPSRGNEAEAQKKTRRWIVNLNKCPGFHSLRRSATPRRPSRVSHLYLFTVNKTRQVWRVFMCIERWWQATWG